RRGASPVGRRRTAFPAAKPLALFFAYPPRDATPNPLWERVAYGRPALDAPAAPAVHPRRVADDDELGADAIVVGSGAGGAVAAAELARAGRKVVVLEQGALTQETEFDGRESAGAARLFWDRQLLATDDRAISVFAGRPVG